MQPPLFVRVAKVFGGFAPFFLKNGFIKTSILGRPLTKNVLSSISLDSILRGSLKSCIKWPSVKSTPIEFPGTETANGKKIEFNVKVGDKVLFSKYGGTEIKIDGENYLIMREDDILGISAATETEMKEKK